MEGEFKKCPNGHYYQGSECPYCKKTVDVSPTGTGETKKTDIFDDPNPTGDPTEIGNTGGGSRGRTVILDNPRVNVGQTMFGDPTEFGDPTGDRNHGYRSERKLVGWLVTYTWDATGMDFKLNDY